MRSAILKRLDVALLRTNSLAEGLDDNDLALCIKDVPSNSIGSQFWCVVGARESYGRAIKTGSWQGFSCSLTREGSKESGSIQAALETSRAAINGAISTAEMSEQRWQLLYDLWEHEAFHQGQFVRYFYANAILFPVGFADRYALTQPESGTSKA